MDINRFTAVDLQKTIQDAIELVGWRESGNEGSTRRWTVEYEMPDLPPIAGPAGELTYLFVNLLINACEAMPDGGLIKRQRASRGRRGRRGYRRPGLRHTQRHADENLRRLRHYEKFRQRLGSIHGA